jgi:sec-independent protein translocase protein TatA
MGTSSVWHWVIVLVPIVLFFGRGRISGLLCDLGRVDGRFRRILQKRESATRRLPAEFTASTVWVFDPDGGRDYQHTVGTFTEELGRLPSNKFEQEAICTRASYN